MARNFGNAAGLAKPPSQQALKRRLLQLTKAKREDLKLYKSGNEEQYNLVDQLLEEYIELTDSLAVILLCCSLCLYSLLRVVSAPYRS